MLSLVACRDVFNGSRQARTDMLSSKKSDLSKHLNRFASFLLYLSIIQKQ